MFSNGTKLFQEVFRNEQGQDLIEYAIVAGLIGVGAVISLSSLTTKIRTAFNTVGNQLTNAT
jgi:pilus assembly protein Flp/PilA